MTETPQLLSEEQIAEIEAAEPFFGTDIIPLSCAERDALCQTVRALTAALHKADEIVVDAIAKTDAAEQNHRRVIAQLEDSRTRLAQVEKERERLLRGEFTPEEFQNLCHNVDIQEGFDVFADGCEAYQQKLFGRCRTKGKVQ